MLVEDDPARGLGPALAWSHRQQVRGLHLLADRATGLLARRAGAFTTPITVWQVDGRELRPAVAEPLATPLAAAPEHLALVPTIEAGGASPVVEHGVVTGEVRGLEVCRVVDDAAGGRVRLEVGVGVHDREAFALIHGDVPTVDALAGVVQAVTRHRGGAAGDHPLDRLAPERLLRWRLQQDPTVIGLQSLVPAEPPVPRPSIKDRAPCTALGRNDDGSGVIVCSVGVDLDVIPYATDARRLGEDGPGVGGGTTGTTVVLPPRDLVPVTAELAGLLDQAVELLSCSPSG